MYWDLNWYLTTIQGTWWPLEIVNIMTSWPYEAIRVSRAAKILKHKLDFPFNNIYLSV